MKHAIQGMIWCNTTPVEFDLVQYQISFARSSDVGLGLIQQVFIYTILLGYSTEFKAIIYESVDLKAVLQIVPCKPAFNCTLVNMILNEIILNVEGVTSLQSWVAKNHVMVKPL